MNNLGGSRLVWQSGGPKKVNFGQKYCQFFCNMKKGPDKRTPGEKGKISQNKIEGEVIGDDEFFLALSKPQFCQQQKKRL